MLASIIGWIAVAALLFATIAYIKAALFKQHRSLILAPRGFQDTNICPEIVPWAAVKGVKVVRWWFGHGLRSIAVEASIQPSGWNGLTLTRSAASNKKRGSFMWIGSVDSITVEQLAEIMNSYMKANRISAG